MQLKPTGATTSNYFDTKPRHFGFVQGNQMQIQVIQTIYALAKFSSDVFLFFFYNCSHEYRKEKIFHIDIRYTISRWLIFFSPEELK